MVIGKQDINGQSYIYHKIYWRSHLNLLKMRIITNEWEDDIKTRLKIQSNALEKH